MKKISRRNFLLASGVVTVGAALAACGGGSSSSTAASSAAPASSAAASAPAAAEGKVLNIWCWNDEFQSRFNDYYPEVKEIAADKSTTTLKDGTTVKWTINANENNNYQNKLDEALLNQDSAADDDKIDIFLIEADYALKYVDSDYVLDVKKDIGLTDSDLAGQYQYTKDIVSVDGSQRGTTWQATPGLFAYRRSIAKDVLGTDDPAEVQTYLSDWDKFNDVAAKLLPRATRCCPALTMHTAPSPTTSPHLGSPAHRYRGREPDEVGGPDQGVHRQGLQQQVQPVGQPVGFRSGPHR